MNEKAHIVVIDDNISSLDVVTDILEDEQYNVTPLRKLPDLRELMNLKPDLILLDIFLGSQDGRIFCSSIRSFPEFSEIPIILFSVYEVEKSEIEEVKANGFIRKPFELYSFLKYIKLHLKTTIVSDL
jgi:CheY-like chemotaxis protein